MPTNTLIPNITDDVFKLKQKSSQFSYLCFCISGVYYAINTQNISCIIDKPSMVYLSHMSPPIIALQHYNNGFIPVLDFAGYRPYSNNGKLLVMSANCFRQDKPFALVIDDIYNIVYFKPVDLKQNGAPFNELLPSFYFVKHKGKKIHFIDIQDLVNQID